ncbi:alpha/beta hydrolase [Ktedonosporobacter rubrisoli]|uniref:Alpha/beta hydrolase n=1 Tax=Ktedonosporobacter rubrisoli TaxID=2509675 RepID=A0A4P6JKK6_KTERU|nr:alpha/beta hydrolase [Ktedonosporobacter rubrisoli]QBD75699.1 alpha/beta hydrolase [Ktedonosporobacter rubrisoli]
MPEATLHDGSSIEIEVHGSGPTLLLPVNPQPVTGAQAEAMQQWGVDPALGHSLIKGLSDTYRVIAFDYEGQCFRTPKPDTLTPANVASDFLAVADAVGAECFAYYGYSWLALIGLQLAIRTERLSALIMGGFPPLGGPYEEMLRVTTATYEIASGVRAVPSAEESAWSGAVPSEDQTRQFVTLYQALQGFDDRAAQAQITCPRLCFVGSADENKYDEHWGNVLVSLAGPIVRRKAELQELGWAVRILDGLDHTQAMQAKQVVPILRSWLASQLRS